MPRPKNKPEPQTYHVKGSRTLRDLIKYRKLKKEPIQKIKVGSNKSNRLSGLIRKRVIEIIKKIYALIMAGKYTLCTDKSLPISHIIMNYSLEISTLYLLKITFLHKFSVNLLFFFINK